MWLPYSCLLSSYPRTRQLSTACWTSRKVSCNEPNSFHTHQHKRHESKSYSFLLSYYPRKRQFSTECWTSRIILTCLTHPISFPILSHSANNENTPALNPCQEWPLSFTLLHAQKTNTIKRKYVTLCKLPRCNYILSRKI